MTLNQYAAEHRLAIFDELKRGLPPSQGEFDRPTFEAGKVKGQPQMGTTRYEPQMILVEFIYPDPLGAATVLTVRLPSPERIVFLPVPSWVVESIWQGEIDGTFHFESEAMRLLEELRQSLEPVPNSLLFGPKQATRRV
jgi:hypothetical protein